MSILNTIKNTFIQSSKNSASNSGIKLARQFLSKGNQNKPLIQDWSQVIMSDTEFYKGYPYAAINNRANRVVQLAQNHLVTTALPAVMDQYKNKSTELIHPYLELIDMSPSFSNTKFWYDISTYLDLEGIYYIMVVRAVKDSKVGKVQQFKLLNPYNVRRVVNETTGELGGYVEFKNNLQREIPKEMIIEIRKLNPFNDNDTFAMTDAAAEAQFTMKQSGDYTRFSLKNNMSAPGIITTDITMEDERFANFVSRIKNQEKGDPLFGNGEGAIKWDPMQINLDKAALGAINEINRQELFAVSGVGKTMLAIEESGTTRDTAKVQKDLFTEYHALPQIQLVIDALNQDYKNNYPDDYKNTKISITVDNPTGVDKDAKLKGIQITADSFELYTSLIQAGYESQLSAKYVNGDIGLEDLGEPTKLPEAIVATEEPASTLVAELPEGTPKDTYGSKNGFDVPALYSSIKPLIDGSVSLVFRTEQIEQAKINEMLAYYRKTGKLSFTEGKTDKLIKDDDMPDDDTEDTPDGKAGAKKNKLPLIENYNPHHDELGRFTFGPSGKQVDFGDATNDEADKYITEKYSDQLDSISDDSSKALKMYAGHDQAFQFNRWVRNGMPHTMADGRPPDEAYGKVLKKYDKIVAGMDAAISAGKLKENTILYRSALGKNLTVGSVIKDKAYSSTSLTKEAPKRFLGMKIWQSQVVDKDLQPYLVKINAPKGTSGTFVGQHTKEWQQSEFILPRDTSLKVTAIKEVKSVDGNYLEVEAEVSS